MQHLIINFSICLFSLWLVYKLLLENTSWHQFKRFYLLGALVVAFMIPTLVIKTTIVDVPQASTFTPINSAIFQEKSSQVPEITAPATFQVNWNYVLWIIYAVGALIMSVRFARNLQRLSIQPSDHLDIYECYTLVLRHIETVPHSFYNRIYASAIDYKEGKIPNAVLQHEKAHLDQKHSWDILFLELLLIVMWFNPVLHLLKYSIKLNHEFLADHAILSSGYDSKAYQEILLAYSFNSQNLKLVNTINFPIIKKRFTIMKTHTSNISLLLRILIVIPVLTTLVISCGQEKTEYAYLQNQNSNPIATEQVAIAEPSNIISNERVYAEPGEVITPEIYHKYTTFKKYKTGLQYADTIIGQDLIYTKKFDDFTEEEKKGKNAFPIMYVPKPLSSEELTDKEMEELLNEKIFRVWVDGEEVENEVLKNYKPSDFEYYSGRMFVHKTGRKTHRQAFNISLQTPEYFEKSNLGKQRKYYGNYDMTTYESFVKKGGYYNRKVDNNLNLPQQILSHIELGSNGNTLTYLNGERFTYKEILTKLKNYPNALINVDIRDNKNTISVDLESQLGNQELQNLLETVSKKY